MFNVCYLDCFGQWVFFHFFNIINIWFIVVMC